MKTFDELFNEYERIKMEHMTIKFAVEHLDREIVHEECAGSPDQQINTIKVIRNALKETEERRRNKLIKLKKQIMEVSGSE